MKTPKLDDKDLAYLYGYASRVLGHHPSNRNVIDHLTNLPEFEMGYIDCEGDWDLFSWIRGWNAEPDSAVEGTRIACINLCEGFVDLYLNDPDGEWSAQGFNGWIWRDLLRKWIRVES